MQRAMSGFRPFNPRGLTNSGDVARPERSEKAASSRTSTNIETVGRMLPAGACDCHAHVYGPFDQFPLPSSAPFQPPPASIQVLEKLWESFGIERGVIVQGSAYRQDHRALLGALRRDPQNRRGVALVGSDTSDAVIDQLHASGVRGARMNLVRHLSSGFDESRCREVVQRIEPFGWHLELHVDADDLGRLRRFVEESPINVVVDHMGRVDAALGTDQPPFRTLLKLISCPHCWVKLSGADRLAKRCPLETAVSFARPLMEVAPDRVVWGTDWPHVNHEQPQSDAALINLLAEIAPDDLSRTRLLVENPKRLYGF
ncbi:MAG: amidohydrolase family protein [Chthoniobacterales bacterium]